MALKKYKLGELIELVEETNAIGNYGPDDVMGVTITKEIIPTRADVAKTDLKNFLVVKPREFVYNPRTHGKKIGFGFNSTNKSFIVSWNNIAFRVKGQSKEKVLAEYLFLHFNRNEWDREACFHSWGTSTEVFSWDAICEMNIVLPSIEVQRKYVDVYLAVQENLAVYQSKRDELKTVCDGYVNLLKRKCEKVNIGDFVEQYDERSSNGEFDVNAVMGISTEKTFIETKANMNGVNLDSYKVVQKDTFAYVPDTSRRGDKIAIALNRGEDPILVSSIYSTFRSKDTSKLLPEYLFMFFNRPEFDRYARFHSWGSAREVFTMDDMNEVRIPLPDITVQQEIVNIHKCYLERQRIAEELKAQINRLCPVLIKGSLQDEN